MQVIGFHTGTGEVQCTVSSTVKVEIILSGLCAGLAVGAHCVVFRDLRENSSDRNIFLWTYIVGPGRLQLCLLRQEERDALVAAVEGGEAAGEGPAGGVLTHLLGPAHPHRAD